jgi:hypothetical protein
MRLRFLIVLCLGFSFELLNPASSRASLVYIYDFPGTPGSGLAVDQTNPQLGHSTFGDWSRVNVSQVGTTDVFDSNFWNTTAVFDSTQYASFSITADPGYHLNLELLTFDQSRTSGGPTKGLVEMFLNGSSTPYASFNYNPSSSVQNKTFNFTPTTDADNVTSVEYRFYGWNGGTPDASLIFDNVAVTVSIVPEVSPFWPVTLLLGCVLLSRNALRRGFGRIR